MGNLFFNKNSNTSFKNSEIKYEKTTYNRKLISNNSNHLFKESNNYYYNKENPKKEKYQKHVLLFYKLVIRPRIYSYDQTYQYEKYDENEDFENITFKLDDLELNNQRSVNIDIKNVYCSQISLFMNSETLNSILNKNYLVKNGGIKLLKYSCGCFSSKHKDQFGDYTCLYFPAKMIFIGGELIFYDEKFVSYENREGKFIFDPSNLEHDVLVIFSSSTFHEVLPVKSGIRYCLKLNLVENISYEKQRSIIDIFNIKNLIPESMRERPEPLEKLLKD